MQRADELFHHLKETGLLSSADTPTDDDPVCVTLGASTLDGLAKSDAEVSNVNSVAANDSAPPADQNEAA
jgi:hypothetical protein